MQLVKGVIRSAFYMLVVQILFSTYVGIVQVTAPSYFERDFSDFVFSFKVAMHAFYAHMWWVSLCIFLFFFAIHLFKMRMLFKTIRTLLLIALIGGAIYVVFYSIALMIGLLIISACVWLGSSDVTYLEKDWNGNYYFRRGRKFQIIIK